MRVSKAIAWLGALACATSVAARARAEPVRLRYAAPAACPDEASFVAQIRARTTRVEDARGDEPARAFRVAIELAGEAFRGSVVIREVDGREAVREVPAAPCDEVVAALALITAVAIDPEASLAPAPPVAPKPPRAPVPAAPRASPGPTVKPSPPPPPSPTRLRGALGADLAVATAVAPDPVPAFEGFAELRLDASRVLSPSLRAAFFSAASGNTTTSIGTAHFTWYAGRVEACPVRWPPPLPARRPVDGSVTACAAIDVGALVGAAEGAVASKTATKVWASPGLLARAELEIVGHIFVEAQGGLTVPLPSYHFFFGPNDTTLFDVPRLGAIAGGGLGVRLP